MSFLGRLFARKPRLEREHPRFGTLVFDGKDAWTAESITLWDQPGVSLVIDADASGPTPAQDAQFARLDAMGGAMLARCRAALTAYLDDPANPAPRFELEYLSIPALDGTPRGELWNLGFDLRGDGHYVYGIQSEDRWATLEPHRDD